MITGGQLRAARGLVGSDQKEVVESCGISKATLSAIENGSSGGQAETLYRLQAFYEARGVVFTEDEGVRFNRSGLRRFRGPAEFRRFYDQVFETARRDGGSICIFNGAPAALIRLLGEEFYETHAQRMAAIKDRFSFRVIIRENDRNLIGGSFAEYRWWPNERFGDRMLYVCGDMVAWIVFDETDVSVLALEDAEIAGAQRELFEIAWEREARPVDV